MGEYIRNIFKIETCKISKRQVIFSHNKINICILHIVVFNALLAGIRVLFCHFTGVSVLSIFHCKTIFSLFSSSDIKIGYGMKLGILGLFIIGTNIFSLHFI